MLSGLTSFDPRPRLGLVEQGSQLPDQLEPLPTRPVERADSLQALEYRACLFHSLDGIAGTVTYGTLLVARFVLDRGAERRPRAHSEELAVELVREPRSIARPQDGDKGPASSFQSRRARRIAARERGQLAV
jgi:hypothetical protein